MELILTGGTITAEKAESLGIVARTFPAEEIVDATVQCAQTIAAYSGPVVALAKQAVQNGR